MILFDDYFIRRKTRKKKKRSDRTMCCWVLEILSVRKSFWEVWGQSTCYLSKGQSFGDFVASTRPVQAIRNFVKKKEIRFYILKLGNSVPGGHNKSALITFVAKQLCRHPVACEEEGRKMTPGFEERIESTSRQIQDHYLLITCKSSILCRSNSGLFNTNYTGFADTRTGKEK